MLKDKIERLRQERGWSKGVAAKRCGIPYDTFLNLTLGRSTAPNSMTIAKLAKGFDVPVTYFYSNTVDVVDAIKSIAPEQRQEALTAMGYPPRLAAALLKLLGKEIGAEAFAMIDAIIDSLAEKD